MSIANVVTRGYGPSAGIKWIVTKGYFEAGAGSSAVVSGTATSQLTAAKIIAGGDTVILTLENTTWAASGATFDAERQNIIDGMTSAGAEANGWNVEVRAKEVVGAVVRTSDTVVTITLSAAALYSVPTSEAVTITIPASAISDSSPVVAGPVLNAGIVASTGGLWGTGGEWFFFND